MDAKADSREYKTAKEIAAMLKTRHPNWAASKDDIEEAILSGPRDSGTDATPLYDVEKEIKHQENDGGFAEAA